MSSLIKVHFVFSLSGTSGDIHPFLDIAKKLQERSCSVTFLVNDYYQDLISNHGFKFATTGTADEHIKFHKDPRIWDLKQDVVELGFDDFIRPTIISAFSYINRLIKGESEVIIIGTYPLFNGAVLAAELYGLKCVCVTLSPRYILSLLEPPAPLRWQVPERLFKPLKLLAIKVAIRGSKLRIYNRKYFPKLNALRFGLGLPAIGRLNNDQIFNDKFLQLALFPKWFGMPVSDWPKNLNLTDFPLADKKTNTNLTNVDNFILERGPPLIFTFGTGVHKVDKQFKTGIQICRNLSLPGLFVGGCLTEDLFSQIENCMHVDYVDFEKILPKSKAIIHHGGIGTMAQAIKAGVPQLIRPLAYDQHDNADRLLRLRLGSFLLPEHFNHENASIILNTLINNPHIKQSISKYSEKLKRSNASEMVCNLIEDVYIKGSCN